MRKRCVLSLTITSRRRLFVRAITATRRADSEVVRLSVYLPRNARVQMNAMRMGGKPKPLSKGEIAARGGGRSYSPGAPETWRAWEYWAKRAGCGDEIGKPEDYGQAHSHDHTHKG